MNHEELWNRCLKVFKDNVSDASYDTWFSPIVPLSFDGESIMLQVPSMFYYEFIDERFAELLSSVLEREAGSRIKILYKVLGDNKKESFTSVVPSTQQKDEQESTSIMQRKEGLSSMWGDARNTQDLDSQLNPIYNFNTFIEGASNRLARTAGTSIANDPGHTPFNPLFLYGESGVGKTHLAQAIGLSIKQMYPEKRVLYVPANLFYLQFVEATNHANKLNEFLLFYQSIDVLIIDDIQALAGKIKTQQQFFHIFNHLHLSNKQLILTSDRPPCELQGMEDRLLTRFKWGLTTEIEKPDFDLRKAILHSKIYKDGLDIPEDVEDYIARNVVDNVRDLEGVLLSLLAHSTFTNEAINVALAEKVVGHVVKEMPEELSPDKIRDVVCDYFQVTSNAVVGKSRVREVASARHIAMYLSKKLTKCSLSEIGRTVGNRDHATVLHSCSVVGDLMDTDKKFRNSVEEIEKQLKS